MVGLVSGTRLGATVRPKVECTGSNSLTQFECSAFDQQFPGFWLLKDRKPVARELKAIHPDRNGAEPRGHCLLVGLKFAPEPRPFQKLVERWAHAWPTSVMLYLRHGRSNEIAKPWPRFREASRTRTPDSPLPGEGRSLSLQALDAERPPRYLPQYWLDHRPIHRKQTHGGDV
jgi:hypothetical protein